MALATALATALHPLLVLLRGPLVEKAQAEEAEARAAGERGDHIVAVRQGRALATAFHPEVTGDRRVHAFFVDIVTGRA